MINFAKLLRCYLMDSESDNNCEAVAQLDVCCETLYCTSVIYDDDKH